METNSDKCTVVPWFSTSFGELHMIGTIDMCVHMCNIIPCSDTDIKIAAADWRWFVHYSYF